ncbi:MAG: Ig-like domain-containing protein [Reichenbachiella sp.]
MRKIKIKLFCLLGVVLSMGLKFNHSNAQTTVEIDYKTQKFIGDISELDRAKYFNFHSSTGGSWGYDTLLEALQRDYDVTLGRGFYGAFSYSKGRNYDNGTYPTVTDDRDGIARETVDLIATEHPYNVFVDGIDTDAASDWVVEYYTNVISGPIPSHFEPMNEPFVHASEYYEGAYNAAENQRIKRQMCELYRDIGKKIDESTELSNMKVIGYSAAWPSMELGDFGHWNENMKMFIDIAGQYMDAYSTHLYDGVNIEGQDNRRSGSNSEAILDLIESYSFSKWGELVPHSISEYGAIEQGYNLDTQYDLASVQTVKSINHILFNLLNRTDRMDITIPFITGQATWHINEENDYQPYPPVLWVASNKGVPLDQIEKWEYSPRITFFDLWKGVSGKRVYITSDNLDVQVQAFLDTDALYIALNNLDDESETVDLTFLETVENISEVNIKSIEVYSDKDHVFTNETGLASIPASVELVAGETTVIEVKLSTPLAAFEKTIRSKRYYQNKTIEFIGEGRKNLFKFTSVRKGEGLAQLSLGIGRKHDRSKKPKVLVNGVEVEVPDNWKGYDQANRDDFFGLLEIPFNTTLLANGDNIISIEFPDTGGTISSLVLQTELFDGSVATDGISISPPMAELDLDETIELSASITAEGFENENVVWSSLDPAIASVSPNGLVTAETYGIVDIAAKTQDGTLVAYSTMIIQEEVLSTGGDQIDRSLGNSIYPNPYSTGNLNINVGTSHAQGRIDILNLSGQILLSKSFSDQSEVSFSQNEINNSIPEKLVLVRVVKGNNVESYKLIIKK